MALFEFVDSFRGEVEGFIGRDNRFVDQNNGLVNRWIYWLETLVYEDNLLLPELFFIWMSEKGSAFKNIFFFKFLALILSLRYNYIILSCDLILSLIFDVVHLERQQTSQDSKHQFLDFGCFSLVCLFNCLAN